uniref:RPA interacting protein n=1 Tax=Anas platyrhynchos TaxID=8839 RepID=A0A8B9SNM3_ANAPL
VMEEPLRGHRELYKAPGLAAPHWKEAYRRVGERSRGSGRAKLLERYRRAGDGGGTGPGALLVPEVMEMEWRSLQAARRGDAAQVSAWGQPLSAPPPLPDLLWYFLTFMSEVLQFDEECLNAMLDGLDASNKIICPGVQKVRKPSALGAKFCTPTGMTEQKLRALLENTLTEHSYRCLHNPEFTVTGGMEEEMSLLMTCPVCDSWTVLL